MRHVHTGFTGVAMQRSVVLGLAALDGLNAQAMTEQHVMVPMRDGVRLSMYLYIPDGTGPWPVLYEQRYSDVTVESSKRSYRMLASKGYGVAAEEFAGAPP